MNRAIGVSLREVDPFGARCSIRIRDGDIRDGETPAKSCQSKKTSALDRPRKNRNVIY